jgi:hypothetical protein
MTTAQPGRSSATDCPTSERASIYLDDDPFFRQSATLDSRMFSRRSLRNVAFA